LNIRRKNKAPVAAQNAIGAAPDRREALRAQVWQLVQPLCAAEGLELVFVEFQRESAGAVLRLYIDKPGGVSLEDCTRISPPVSDLLDVALDAVGPYRLEVSSPGVDRPLGRAADYQRFTGHEARIRIAPPIGDQRNFRGILRGVVDGLVRLEVGGLIVEIALDRITKARLVNYYGENGC
jgi:ribosome maturation factor RimP